MISAMPSPRETNGSATSGRAALLIGRVYPELGGPLATLSALHRVLRLRNLAVETYVGRGSELADLSGIRAETASFGNIRRAAKRADVIIVVGVWHYVFALVALAGIWRRQRRQVAVIVPTNSLTRWDWRKHRFVKSVLRPMLLLGMRSFTGVVYASTGELKESNPKPAWLDHVVIPHVVRKLGPLDDRSTPQLRNITFSGRVSPQKDLPLLFRAVAAMQRPRPQITICGPEEDSGLAADLRRYARTHDLDVVWRGKLDARDLASTLQASAAVAVTSRSENFCHAAAESLALGVPVVMVRRVASALDFSDNPIVKLCDASADDVAAALTSVVEHPPSAGDRVAAIQWIEDRMSEAAVFERWQKIFAGRHATSSTIG